MRRSSETPVVPSSKKPNLSTEIPIALPDEILYQILAETNLYTIWTVCRRLGWDEKYLSFGLKVFKKHCSATWAIWEMCFDVEFWNFLAQNSAALSLEGHDLQHLLRYSSTELLELLLGKNGFPLSPETFRAAAFCGNLNNMKWLREKGCPWDENTFSETARVGDVVSLIWLKEHGCPWNENTFAEAAGHGRLDNMKWLRENGCPWDERTFERAAIVGNLKNMKWLRKQGCPWDRGATIEAARLVNPKYLRWF